MFALYTDHAGRIWVGTDGGLSRYEPATEAPSSTTAGPPTAPASPTCRCASISEDHTGALWIGTLHGGLDRLEPGSGRVTAFRHDPANPHSLSTTG